MVVIVIMIFTAFSTGAYYLMYYKKDDNKSISSAKPSIDLSLDSAKPAVENKQATSDLKVQGVSTTNPESSQVPKAPALPVPSGFKVYEQYATSETAQYQDISVGTGLEAGNGDTVAVTYKGWLTDGTLFDQSTVNDQNQAKPFIFVMGSHSVIPGWEQTIFGMKEGGKRRLVIPSKLGYGGTAQGPIPANSMLIFDVELVQVQKP